jgi:hypothetical protein
MKAFEKLKELVAGLQGDVDKAEKGNKAACVRLRAGYQAIKALANEGRDEALAIKKA